MATAVVSLNILAFGVCALVMLNIVLFSRRRERNDHRSSHHRSSTTRR